MVEVTQVHVCTHTPDNWEDSRNDHTRPFTSFRTQGVYTRYLIPSKHTNGISVCTDRTSAAGDATGKECTVSYIIGWAAMGG